MSLFKADVRASRWIVVFTDGHFNVAGNPSHAEAPKQIRESPQPINFAAVTSDAGNEQMFDEYMAHCKKSGGSANHYRVKDASQIGQCFSQVAIDISAEDGKSMWPKLATKDDIRNMAEQLNSGKGRDGTSHMLAAFAQEQTHAISTWRDELRKILVTDTPNGSADELVALIRKNITNREVLDKLDEMKREGTLTLANVRGMLLTIDDGINKQLQRANFQKIIAIFIAGIASLLFGVLALFTYVAWSCLAGIIKSTQRILEDRFPSGALSAKKNALSHCIQGNFTCSNVGVLDVATHPSSGSVCSRAVLRLNFGARRWWHRRERSIIDVTVIDAGSGHAVGDRLIVPAAYFMDAKVDGVAGDLVFTLSSESIDASRIPKAAAAIAGLVHDNLEATWLNAPLRYMLRRMSGSPPPAPTGGSPRRPADS